MGKISGGNVSEWWGVAVNTDETSLTCPQLTSGYLVQILTGHGLVPFHGPGSWTPTLGDVPGWQLAQEWGPQKYNHKETNFANNHMSLDEGS